MEKKENAVIACEIKIGVTAKSWSEIQEMLRKIREACDFDHKLKINFDGEFFKIDNFPESPTDTEKLLKTVEEKTIPVQLVAKLVKELQTENSFQEESPC